MQERIMVVDDDPMICKMCEALLKNAGYETVTHLSGTRCMSYLRNPSNPSVDLIILDVEMPSMNGFKTLSSIRALSSYASAPVMFLTSSCTKETVPQALSLGAKDYLKKPFTPDELLRRVEKLLGHSSEAQT